MKLFFNSEKKLSSKVETRKRKNYKLILAFILWTFMICCTGFSIFNKSSQSDSAFLYESTIDGSG